MYAPVIFVVNKHKAKRLQKHGMSYTMEERMFADLNTSGVNPTNFFLFGNEEFFLFSLLSLAVVQYTNFFHMPQTLQINTENRKTGKIKVW